MDAGCPAVQDGPRGPHSRLHATVATTTGDTHDERRSRAGDHNDRRPDIAVAGCPRRRPDEALREGRRRRAGAGRRQRRVRPRPLHGGDGTVGVGEVDAHALPGGAGLADPGQRVRRGSEVGRLDDAALTQLRRDRVGFVFQSFNLIPTLTASGEHHAPSDLGGKVDRELVRRPGRRLGIADRLSHRPTSCPAASSSGSPAPGP